MSRETAEEGRKTLTALGLMSGTSMDGVDMALITSDGENDIVFGPSGSLAYAPAERSLLKAAMEKARELNTAGEGEKRVPATGVFAEAADLVTQKHAGAVRAFLRANQLSASDVDVIGFHGQTILHRPEHKMTCQIGDGRALAEMTGIDVVCDFRSADVAAGGQGAPLAPLYHQALAAKISPDYPVAVVNLGGVGNVTFAGRGDLLAFDTGPGNALLDDWMLEKTGRPMDEEGRMARSGKVDGAVLSEWMRDPYFAKAPPKSLDRIGFATPGLEGLSVEDGAATLTAFTVNSILKAADFFPERPRRWIVCGGARHNDFMMGCLARALPRESADPPGGNFMTADRAGWPGDELEAQAFAWLAIRSRHNLPLTLPRTTGCAFPVCGGVYFSS